MLAKWFNSIDFGKLILNTSSGFVVTIAVIFFIDALVPGHMSEQILSDLNAGEIVVFGLAALLASSIFGLLMDCIYHAFGRWYASWFWAPLDWSKTWRVFLMRNIGLITKDFEWMYADSPAKLKDSEVEKDYMRFTEIAGSTAYTMMLLLAPAVYMFLRVEYPQPIGISLAVALIVLISGYVLLLTNAASLRKYEDRKTSVVLREIRKSSTSFDTKMIKQQCEDQKCSVSQFKLTKIIRSLGIVLVSGMLIAFSQILVNHQLTEENGVANMNIIGATENITADNKGVPGLDIIVTKEKTTPVDQAKSLSVVIKDFSHTAVTIGPKELDLIAASGLNIVKPLWKLNASLVNTENIMDGDRVYINVLLSFHDASNVDIPSNNLSEGEWLFPIIVKDSNHSYLLAQVHVKINPAAPEKTDSGDATAEPKTESPK
jgi:hypothetical protein